MKVGIIIPHHHCPHCHEQRKLKKTKFANKRDKHSCAVVHCSLMTRRAKGAKDEVKRPKGPPTRSRGPEGP